MIKTALRKEALLHPEKAKEQSFNLFLIFFLNIEEFRKENSTRMDKTKHDLVPWYASLD